MNEIINWFWTAPWVEVVYAVLITGVLSYAILAD